VAAGGVPIGSAARALGTTARMLRYREELGLLPPPPRRGGRRVFSDRDLAAARAAIELEDRYRVGPSALAFALRCAADPAAGADVQALGQLAQRLAAPALAALAFEAQKARHLLGSAERGLDLDDRGDRRRVDPEQRRQVDRGVVAERDQ
jgi:MerR family copper efflux transcriptional regulator